MTEQNEEKISALLQRIKKRTYLLNKVLKELQPFEDQIIVELMTHKLSSSMHPDGCHMIVKNTKWMLSIQTATCASGDALCETALLWNDKLVYINQLGYFDVIRHYSSSKFGQHIASFLKAIQGKTVEDFETN